MKFDAYFQEEVSTSAEEHYRIRHVGLYYYLEDDSMCIIEPKVKNSGLLQGKLMRRHRVPKNEQGDYYHWKDLNVGIDLPIYGRTYRLVNCDSFTKVCSRESTDSDTPGNHSVLITSWSPQSFTLLFV